jgi:Wax ester synthase-like Acyl-CoA acyltransferase domain
VFPWSTCRCWMRAFWKPRIPTPTSVLRSVRCPSSKDRFLNMTRSCRALRSECLACPDSGRCCVCIRWIWKRRSGVDTENFDISHHVHRVALPHPGDDAELFWLTADVMERRLDQAGECEDEEHERPDLPEAAVQVATEGEQAGCRGHVPHDLTEQGTGPVGHPDPAIVPLSSWHALQSGNRGPVCAKCPASRLHYRTRTGDATHGNAPKAPC